MNQPEPMNRTPKRRLPLFSSLLVLAASGDVSAQSYDILACSVGEKAAVTPTDKLDCEWKNGLFVSTLAQLYGEHWRLVETAFFDGTRQVLYLERAPGTAPPAP